MNLQVCDQSFLWWTPSSEDISIAMWGSWFNKKDGYYATVKALVSAGF